MPIYVPDSSNVLKELSSIMVTTPDNVVREIAEGWHTGEDKVSRLVYENIKETIPAPMTGQVSGKKAYSYLSRMDPLKISIVANGRVVRDTAQMSFSFRPKIQAKAGDKLVFKNVIIVFDRLGKGNIAYECTASISINNGAKFLLSEHREAADFPNESPYSITLKKDYELVLDAAMEINSIRFRGTMSNSSGYDNAKVYFELSQNPKDTLIAKHPIEWRWSE